MMNLIWGRIASGADQPRVAGRATNGGLQWQRRTRWLGGHWLRFEDGSVLGAGGRGSQHHPTTAWNWLPRWPCSEELKQLTLPSDLRCAPTSAT